MRRFFILHIEDSDADAFLAERALRAALRATSPVVLRTSTVREAEALLSRLKIDAVVLDLRLPDVYSLDESILRVRRMTDAPILVVSDTHRATVADSVLQDQVSLFVHKERLNNVHVAAQAIAPFFQQMQTAA